jgi:hypothetical protein
MHVAVLIVERIRERTHAPPDQPVGRLRELMTHTPKPKSISYTPALSLDVRHVRVQDDRQLAGVLATRSHACVTLAGR